MNELGIIHSHLEWLRSGDAGDPDHSYSLQLHVAEEWMQATGLTRRQILDVVAAWLAFGFDSGRLTFDFGDMIANNLHWVAQAKATDGTSRLTEWHTPLSWAVYLAFDAGEFTFEPDFDPVEGNTRPQIADIVCRIDELIEYPPAVATLRDATPFAAS